MDHARPIVPLMAPPRADRSSRLLLIALAVALAAHLGVLSLLRSPAHLPRPAEPQAPVIFERAPEPSLRSFAPPAAPALPPDAAETPAPLTTPEALPAPMPLAHLSAGRRAAASHSTGASASTRSAPSPASVPAAASSAAGPPAVAPAVIAPSCGIQTPPYPPEARLLHQSGVVGIQLTVAPGGAVTDASLAVSSGSDALDDAALAAAREARCVNNGPRAATLRLPVGFRLE